jgi:hypothetical protein
MNHPLPNLQNIFAIKKIIIYLSLSKIQQMKNLFILQDKANLSEQRASRAIRRMLKKVEATYPVRSSVSNWEFIRQCLTEIREDRMLRS